MLFARIGSVLVLSTVLFGQADPAVQSARAYRQTHELEIVESFMQLLTIPNLAAEPEQLQRNAETIGQLLRKRGIATQMLEHSGAPPVVYGELMQAGATRTIVFYAHYDGSPLNAKEWSKPPFQPVLRNGSIERDGQVIPLPKPGSPLILNGAFMHDRRAMIRHPSWHSWSR